MADLCCRRFVLLPIQNMADQIHRVNSLVREFDFHDKTEDKLAEVAILTKKIIFKVSAGE